MSLINREGSINSHNGSNSGSVIEGVIVEETDNIKVENSNNNNQNNVNNNMGVMVSSMLETSEILDERFYEDHNRPTWMNKSFDLKTIENPNSDRPDSFIFTVESSNPTPSKLTGHYSNGGRSTTSRKNNRPSGEKNGRDTSFSSHSSRVSYPNDFEAYKNNTFINHVPVP